MKTIYEEQYASRDDYTGNKIKRLSRTVAWIWFAVLLVIGLICAVTIPGLGLLILLRCIAGGVLFVVQSWWNYGYGMIVQDTHRTARAAEQMVRILERIEEKLNGEGTGVEQSAASPQQNAQQARTQSAGWAAGRAGGAGRIRPGRAGTQLGRCDSAEWSPALPELRSRGRTGLGVLSALRNRSAERKAVGADHAKAISVQFAPVDSRD